MTPGLLSPLVIGSCKIPNRMMAAPMAGITDLPFRTILRDFGAGLTFSEMVSAEAYTRGHRKTQGILERAEGERPFAIQLFGGTPSVLARAARLLEREQRCDLVDLNLACPVRKVLRSGSGAALMRDPKRLFQTVQEVFEAVSLPVTVKMRACDVVGDEKGLGLIPQLFSRGIAAVFLHARCVSWGFSHSPRWEWIRQAVIFGRPVVGNGSIFTPQDAIRMTEETKCDGIMIARGMLGNPWIFRQIREFVGTGEIRPVSLAERAAVMERHLALSVETFGKERGVLRMRKHLAWYVKGLPLASEFRGRINVLGTEKEVLEEIRRYFRRIRGRAKSSRDAG